MFDRILILQHKGGEYLSINISGITEDRSIIKETLDRAETIIKKPSTTSNIALQILDSKISENEINEITLWLKKMKEVIQRMAIIGAKIMVKHSMKRSFKRNGLEFNSQFIYDWDTAKDWMVGKPRKK